MNELEQLASGEEVLKTMVSHIRELSEDEKIRQQCAARADYESRLVSQYNQGIKQGIEQNLTAVVLRMHARGKNIEDIMIATELSEEDVH